jgi:hypothetical protein
MNLVLVLVRVRGVEPRFHPWEGYIIAVIRYPHGAEDGTRTHDLLVTNELLYQLSHFGESVTEQLYSFPQGHSTFL